MGQRNFVSISPRRRFLAILIFLGLVSPLIASSIDERFDSYRGALQFIDYYCIDCHASDVRKGEIDFEGLPEITDASFMDRDRWVRMFEQLKVSAMPPDDELQPTDEERAQVVEWLDERLHFVDTSKPVDPGRVTARRLNKTEYDHTIQDLFGINLSVSNMFPGDDVGYGFDNIGDVHTVSPLRLERFLEAAERISGYVMNAGQRVEMNRNEQAVFFDRHNRYGSSDAGFSFAPDGYCEVDFEFPFPGEYEIRVDAWGIMPDSVFKERNVDDSVFWPEHANAYEEGDEQPLVPLSIKLSGEPIFLQQIDQGLSSTDFKAYKTRFKATMGVHRLTFNLITPEGLSDEEREAWEADPPRVGIRQARIVGPYSADFEKLDTFHQFLLATEPSEQVSVREAATTIVENLLERAYRRPATKKEIRSLSRLMERQVASGLSFKMAVESAIQVALVSPHFLYRLDMGPKDKDPDFIRPLGDFALASRLSYFLWSSAPDRELLELASGGKLNDDEVLRQQVARMLEDRRSKRFVPGFFRQWLDLRKLNGLIFSEEHFKEFEDDHKKAVETETLMFVESLLRDNGSLLDMIQAKYTFMNERVAELYGMEGIEGNEFRRVSLEGTRRQGLLTQPSVLMLTSYPDRTSPTKRGNWILEAIMGEEPPEAPANVPALEEAAEASGGGSLRDHLELHRTNKTCASCHAMMDPIGIGLENFDAIGRWREKDGEYDIDPSGVLPGGETFETPEELLEILAGREEDFARRFTEKLMTYSLGRGLEYYDRIAVDSILEKTKENNYRIVEIMTEVVLSRPFRLSRGVPIVAKN